MSSAEVSAVRQVAVLTGAGVSTESNIPDYRGPAGAYSTGFKPMTHQQVCCGRPRFKVLACMIIALCAICQDGSALTSLLQHSKS